MAQTYKILSGDTASKIAKQYGTTVDELQKANPQYSQFTSNADYIQAGWTLNIPTTDPTPTPTPTPKPTLETIEAGLADVAKGTKALQERVEKEGITDVEKPSVEDTGVSTGETVGEGKTPEQIAAEEDAARKAAIMAEVQAELDGNQTGATTAVTGDTVGGPEAPETIDWAAKGQELITKYAEPIESEIADIDKQIADIEALYETGKVEEGKRLTSMGIIRKRQGAVSKEQQIELNRLINHKNALTTLLSSKYNMINTLMSATQQTYQDARGNYEFEYNKSIQLQQLAAQTEDRDMDNARATINTITNMMSASGITWDGLSESMQDQIWKLELQSGIPMGTLQSFIVSHPKSKVIATKDGYDAAGNAIISFIYEDENGVPEVGYVLKTGGVKSTAGDDKPDKPTSAEIKAEKEQEDYKWAEDYIGKNSNLPYNDLVYEIQKNTTELNEGEIEGMLKGKGEKFITKEKIIEIYGEKELIEKAKEYGYGVWIGKGWKKEDEMNAFLDEVMKKVELRRKDGMSDNDIVTQIVDIFKSVKK